MPGLQSRGLDSTGPICRGGGLPVYENPRTPRACLGQAWGSSSGRAPQEGPKCPTAPRACSDPGRPLPPRGEERGLGNGPHVGVKRLPSAGSTLAPAPAPAQHPPRPCLALLGRAWGSREGGAQILSWRPGWAPLQASVLSPGVGGRWGQLLASSASLFPHRDSHPPEDGVLSRGWGPRERALAQARLHIWKDPPH